ncbi:MAG: SDR family oxidoreductase [Ruminococcus sp.]|nr:SDR family oxidoreductase [Ruminococcus sp.]
MFIKTVLITGASRGIGAKTAQAFAKEGYRVIINYNKSKAEAQTLADMLSKNYNTDCTAYGCDITDSKAVAEMFSEIGTVDVLINNAGISEQKLFTDISDEDWKRMMATNLDGVFYCCREALKGMIQEKNGSIINISSMWGEVGASCEVHYSASKAAVIGLTKALAKEVAPSNIRVNCITPGVIATDMMKGFDEETLESLKEETPLSRLGTPEDIANMTVFLASENAGFITGQILGVNGGFVI